MELPKIKGFQELIVRLKKEFCLDLVKFNQINKGPRTNRLFCLEFTDGHKNQKFMAKFYNSNLKENEGVKREFKAFQFLKNKGFTSIPKAYFFNDRYHYGVYSFEEGVKKDIEDFTEADLLMMIDFIVKLQAIPNGEIKTDFPPANRAVFSIQDYIENVYFHLNFFLKSYKENRNYFTSFKVLKNIEIKPFIDDAIQTLIGSLSPEKLKENISPEEKKLNPSDFGAHNIIFRPDKTLCFLDFEDFGWDDPLRIVADFLSHDQTRKLSEKNKQFFKNEYLRRSHLGKKEQIRLDVAIKLCVLEWFTYHLAAITPERIKSKKSTDLEFNEKNYMKDQVKKLEIRINQIKELT